MQIKTLLNMLEFKGQVPAKRQVYYIFEGKRHFVVFSFKEPTSGNFNVIDPDAVEFANALFAGKRAVTRRDLEEHPKMARLIRKGSFDALNILYILVALGKAKIDQRIKEKALYFNIKARKKK